MRVAAVVVLVSPQCFPGGEILWIFRAGHRVRRGGFQRIAWKSVEFIVTLAICHDARRMRMVVNGSNLANLRHERRVRRLRPCQTRRWPVENAIPAEIPILFASDYSRYAASQSENVLYQRRLFCGLRIQCPSSGYTTSFDGTFCRCIAVKNSRLCV